MKKDSSKNTRKKRPQQPQRVKPVSSSRRLQQPKNQKVQKLQKAPNVQKTQRTQRPQKAPKTQKQQNISKGKNNVYPLQRARQERQRRQAKKYPAYVSQNRVVKRERTPKKVSRNTQERRRSYAGRTLPIFVFAVIALYLIAQLGSMAINRTEINVETVAYGTIDTPISRQGLIVRDEYVVKSNRTGTPFYQYAAGDYVTKDAVVCEVKDTASTDVLEDKLESIDKDILESQKNRSDLSAFAEDIAHIEKQMGDSVTSFAGYSMKTNASYLYTMRSQLENYMSQRNEIWISEDVSSLSQLSEEKDAYEQQLSENMSSITATESGILAMSYDGLEETLQPDKLSEITVGSASGNEQMTTISKVRAVAEGDPLFRVVKSNQWFIVSNFDAQDVADWEEKDVYTLNLTGENGAVSLNAVVYALRPGETETTVVFSCFTHMDAFMNQRMVSFSLESQNIQGLKVPSNAIVEKSLLKIPWECVTESNGSTGVLLSNGSNAKFVPVTVTSSDDTYAYLSQSEAGIGLGDVLVQGTGEDASTYQVQEVQAMPGVYIANSSLARFVPITILDQNQEYAIVKSNSSYGLQAYDTIISDAKNITDGQSIY